MSYFAIKGPIIHAIEENKIGEIEIIKIEIIKCVKHNTITIP